MSTLEQRVDAVLTDPLRENDAAGTHAPVSAPIISSPVQPFHDDPFGYPATGTTAYPEFPSTFATTAMRSAAVHASDDGDDAQGRKRQPDIVKVFAACLTRLVGYDKERQ